MGEISQDSQELWDSNKKQKTDVCVSGKQLRRTICVGLFEFWGFYITGLRKRAVVNHSMLCPLLPQLRNLGSGLGWFHEPSITVWPGDPEICAVSILHLIMLGRDKKVKVCWVPLALLDHIASSHWLAVLGTHPVTGDLRRVLLRTRSISSHHGTSQSSAVMSRVWGGGTGVVIPEN